MAQLEEDYKQARERGMLHSQIPSYYSKPSQRMVRMTGVSPIQIIWPCLRRIVTLNPMNLENEMDSNSPHVMTVAC